MIGPRRKSHPAGSARGLRRFVRDRRGVSAVEFALLAPVLIMLYLGVSVLCGALLAERKAINTTSALADLTAQLSNTTPSSLADICSAANTIMAPYSTTSSALQARISVVSKDSSGNTTVSWSYPCQGLTALSKGAPYSGPAAAMLADGQSMVISELQYVYNAPLTTGFTWLPASHTFSETFFLQPRESQTVACSTC